MFLRTIIVTQDKRITVVDALAHPYLDEGRLRYHSCMCTCCYTTSAGMRQYRVDFEPSAAHPFDDLWERKLTSVQQVKGEKFRRIEDSMYESKKKDERKMSRMPRLSERLIARAGNTFTNIYEGIT